METNHQPQIAVIGGGAAGFFGAINAAEHIPHAHVTVFEGTKRILTKVKISGGGRCNVTHHCLDTPQLLKNYPRGVPGLRRALPRFMPRDTFAWFKGRGVELKVEEDGRVFPVTDNSQTIIDTFTQAAETAGVEVRLGAHVTGIEKVTKSFNIHLKNGEIFKADCVLLATGSSPLGHELANKLGHPLIPGVPSLFTFNIKDPRLMGLEGLSVFKVRIQLLQSPKPLISEGPLLITHWGLSGPAVLRLSAFGARHLHDCHYQAQIVLNLLPEMSDQDVYRTLMAEKTTHPKKTILNHRPCQEVPKRLWQELVRYIGFPESLTYGDLTKTQAISLIKELTNGTYQVTGKGIFKEEFVTAGGVDTAHVDFRTMESKLVKNLYFAGEVLDIDGVTGGFNFQAAWATSWIAAQSMESYIKGLHP